MRLKYKDKGVLKSFSKEWMGVAGRSGHDWLIVVFGVLAWGGVSVMDGMGCCGGGEGGGLG